ncbi:unnamed protein product [Durusdinium trenchii]|uniref:Uncharacterized protein n=1 Tax=Durusdinium trenchii TaxID=1381693 RepID=A0ABP0IGG5_9DINO
MFSESKVLAYSHLFQKVYYTFLSEQLRQDSCTLVIVGPVINDFLFHGTVAIGSTAEEAITSPYVSNHRQILADLLDIGVDMDRIIFTGFPGIECAPFCENFDVDLEWFRRQQDVVNELIEALGPRRWRLELLVRRQFQIHGAHCLRYICEVLPSLNPEDLGKIEIRGAGCSEIAIWYDEIHPAAALHLDMAQDFANNFLVRPHSDSPVKTELLLHRQTTFAARRVRSINCSRVA